jgi:hypothetical protein
MTLTPGKLILAKDYPADADVKAYVAAVEAADGQALELEVIKAYDNFILGCKHDGIWNAIKASCILAGARTLSGALVPLAGTAPDKYGTEGNWSYNRKTGLQGDGSTNYLDTNRAENADPLLNQHLSTYISVAGTGNQCYIGARGVSSTASQITYDSGSLYFISRTVATSLSSAAQLVNFGGLKRNASTVVYRRNGTSSSGNFGTPASVPDNYFVFNRPNVPLYSNARIAFYSIGEDLDLALLDARVSTLISDLGAAIP